MELNREQTIKALHCCSSEEYLCEQCPIDKKTKDACECGKVAARNALALIKELTEELAEANKLLNMHRFLASDNGTTYVIPSVRSIKAEVVKQMQTEIESRCIKGGIYPAFVASTIDQIAKEMQDQEVDNGRETAKC